MRRTKRDLTYLVETTTAEGTKDTALFGERELRLVEHGWRESKFGETTTEGRELAEALREHAEKTYLGEIEDESEYKDRVEYLTDEHGVAELLSEIGYE